MADQLDDKLIEAELKSNAEALKNASIGDLVNKDSNVYKILSEPKVQTEVKEKPKFDTEGLPVIEGVRTYQGDITNAVQNENVTMSKMLSMEQSSKAKKESEEESSARLSNKTFKIRMLLGVLSTILFLAGVGAVAYSYFKKNQALAPVALVQTEKDIISSDEKAVIETDDLSREQLFLKIEEQIKKVPKDLTLRKILLTKKEEDKIAMLKLNELLPLVGARTPEKLLRNLYDEYFFGINFLGEGKPFLLIFTSSYDIAYAGLLEWEQTLKDDLRNILSIEYDEAKTYAFKDRVILNKDARALQDNEGKIFFFYSILDQNTILFAKDADSLKEVLERLRIAKLKK